MGGAAGPLTWAIINFRGRYGTNLTNGVTTPVT
jgi:hypothetical protein